MHLDDGLADYRWLIERLLIFAAPLAELLGRREEAMVTAGR